MPEGDGKMKGGGGKRGEQRGVKNKEQGERGQMLDTRWRTGGLIKYKGRTSLEPRLLGEGSRQDRGGEESRGKRGK